MNPIKRFLYRHRNTPSHFGQAIARLWRATWRLWWGKLLIILVCTLLGSSALLFGVSRWYAVSTRDQPLQLGVTFIADYASFLGVNPRETYDALLDDLDVKHLRLVSYWNKHEVAPGVYDFTELDWQFERAEAADAKVSLALGLRQPRWPECHMPGWHDPDTPDMWQPQLQTYLATVVQRYKDSPALESYQLENEYNLEAFGQCPPPSQERLLSEYNLVKQLDSVHPIVLSRSDNLPALLLSQPQPDIVGMSVYRRVWNTTIYQGYFDYPLPSWYYGGIAGLQKIFTDKDSMLHEMQMEPWPPNGQSIVETSRAEQDKSMNAGEFQGRVDFAVNTGMRTIDLWGAEWWYYRKVVLHDDSLWQAAQHALQQR